MHAELLDYMGDDLAVVDAARVSFDKESDYKDLDWNLHEKDERLIAYLAKHNHWTPFAHCTLKFRMFAPVPIRTQCFKHKAGFVENEESRRYISSTPELFIPEFFREAVDNKKQGSGGKHSYSEGWKELYENHCREAIDLYKSMVFKGVCPEQARFVLPQGVEVSWIWTGSLAAFARFYNQRTDPHAQKEIQELAEQVGEQIKDLFPVSWRALTNGS